MSYNNEDDDYEIEMLEDDNNNNNNTSSKTAAMLLAESLLSNVNDLESEELSTIDCCLDFIFFLPDIIYFIIILFF